MCENKDKNKDKDKNKNTKQSCKQKDCTSQRASFICKTCLSRTCYDHTFVTIINGKWSFYCSASCAPLNIDAYKNDINGNENIKNKEIA